MKIAKNTRVIHTILRDFHLLANPTFKNYLKEQQLKILSDTDDIVNRLGSVCLKCVYIKIPL